MLPICGIYVTYFQVKMINIYEKSCMRHMSDIYVTYFHVRGSTYMQNHTCDIYATDRQQIFTSKRLTYMQTYTCDIYVTLLLRLNIYALYMYHISYMKMLHIWHPQYVTVRRHMNAVLVTYMVESTIYVTYMLSFFLVVMAHQLIRLLHKISF
jgi:hypothetical protein